MPLSFPRPRPCAALLLALATATTLASAGARAEPAALVLAEPAPLLDSPYHRPAELRTLPAKTKVVGRARAAADLQVQLADGTVGWIKADAVEQSAALRVTSPVPLYDGLDMIPKKLGTLAEGERVVRLAPAKRAQRLKVRTEKGVVGYVGDTWALKAADLELPEFDPPPLPRLLDDRLEALVRGRTPEELEQALGPLVSSARGPDGVLAVTWHAVQVVRDGRRHTGVTVRFAPDGNRVEYRGEGTRYLVERLPLARAMRSLPGWELRRDYNFWFAARVKPSADAHLYVRLPLLLLVLVVLAVAVLLPGVLAFAAGLLLARVRPLPNALLHALAPALALGACYTGFLFLALVLVDDEWWVWGLMQLALAVFVRRGLSAWVDEHRCPYCKALDQLELVRESVTGERRATRTRTERVKTGTRKVEHRETTLHSDGTRSERFLGSSTQDVYEDRKYDVAVTERQMETERRCDACGRHFVRRWLRVTEGHT